MSPRPSVNGQREHVGEGGAGQLRGERRAVPGVLDGFDRDVGVRLLELRGALLERGDGAVVESGVDRDLEGELAVGRVVGRGAPGERGREGDRGHDAGDLEW